MWIIILYIITFRVLSKKKIFEKYHKYMTNQFYTSGIYDMLKHTLTDTTFIPNCHGVESIDRCKQYKYKKVIKYLLLQILEEFLFL
jgi:hypothetical protein